MISPAEFYKQLIQSQSCINCSFNGKFVKITKQFPDEELPSGIEGCLCDYIAKQLNIEKTLTTEEEEEKYIDGPCFGCKAAKCKDCHELSGYEGDGMKK